MSEADRYAKAGVTIIPGADPHRSGADVAADATLVFADGSEPGQTIEWRSVYVQLSRITGDVWEPVAGDSIIAQPGSGSNRLEVTFAHGGKGTYEFEVVAAWMVEGEGTSHTVSYAGPAVWVD